MHVNEHEVTQVVAAGACFRCVYSTLSKSLPACVTVAMIELLFKRTGCFAFAVFCFFAHTVVLKGVAFCVHGIPSSTVFSCDVRYVRLTPHRSGDFGEFFKF